MTVTGAMGRLLVGPEEVAARLGEESRILAVSHESPDGDALGCLVAFLLVCEQLGVPCSAFVPGENAFPPEYAFLPKVGEVVRGDWPVVEGGTSVYFFDCASLHRSAPEYLDSEIESVNIDHHPDNPLYGDLNLVDPSAPSTSSLLYEVLCAGRLHIDRDIATALYVGLVTDTGKFQYSNTSPRAHRLAAELQELGVDVVAVSRKVYENLPLCKLLLLGRALTRLDVRLKGALVVSWLENDDFLETGASEGHAEGIIDTLRQTEGARVAALARERLKAGRVETKVSLRCMDGSIDVAAIAHEQGGGGHRQAAGFTAEEDVSTVLAWLEDRVRASL